MGGATAVSDRRGSPRDLGKELTHLIWAYTYVIAVIQSRIDPQRFDCRKDNIACCTSIERRPWQMDGKNWYFLDPGNENFK